MSNRPPQSAPRPPSRGLPAPTGSDRSRAREQIRRHPWLAAFCEVLATGTSVTTAAKAAGITRGAAYYARENHPYVAEAWEEAWEQGTDAFEAEAQRRAIEGTERPVFYKGEVVGHIREYSDRLIEIALRARRPVRWREQVAMELSGSLQPSAEELQQAREAGNDAEVEAAAALIAKRAHVRAA